MNKFDQRHIANVRRYQRRIDSIYKKAAEEAAARSAGLPVPDDYIFTFDDFPAVKKQIDALIATMQHDIEVTVTDGVRAEWDLANEKNDALVSSVLGDVGNIAKYNRTHEDALAAFLDRKRAGLNLSESVWRYANQFKNEIELTLDCGIREGLDAGGMARQLKQYLQYPDMLFRRVRDEHGVLRLSQRAAAFHPGQGVYRSSYKNARRLAATETNIAYRTADHERWQDFDFVVGIEVMLSNNHTCLNNKGQAVPFTDICDVLQGRYPKEFKFTGWHPQCRCIAVTINKTTKEVKADMERIRNGEQPLPPSSSENYVGEMPKGFENWMEDNAERLENAKSMPYFIKDNFVDGDPNNGLRWMSGVQPAEDRQFTALEIAEQRHAARTPEQAQAIQDAWDARREENRLIELGAKNMLKVATGYGESDVYALEKAMQFGELNAVRRETRALAQQLLGIRAQENALADLIPDVHLWHQQYTMSELQAVHTAVKSKLAQWSTLTIEQQAKKLQFEAVDFLGGNMKGVQQKYPTWKVSQSAYLKQLDKVNEQIFWEKLNGEYAQLKQWQVTSKSKSKKLAALLDDYQNAIVAGKKLQAQNAIAEAQITKDKLEKSAMRRAAKKAQTTTSTSFDADAYSQERKNNAMWAKRTADADARLRDRCGIVWRAASQAEKDAIWGYTGEYCNINEPLRGVPFYGTQSKTQRGLRRIPYITDIINRSSYDFDMWLQRGDTKIALKKFGLANYATATDAEIKGLVGATGTEGGFWSAGVAKGTGFETKPVIFNIYAPKGTRAMYCEPFSQFGDGAGRGWDGISKQSFFGGEAEILLQRGTTFRITKVEKAAGQWFIDVEIIEQNPLPFPYVGGYPYK